MRGFSRRIVSAMFVLILSVSAYAVSIDVLSYDVAAPVVLTEYDRDVTVVTHKDFVATTPYVVVLDTATPIPIDSDAFGVLVDQAIEEVARATDEELRNHPAMQNVNLERTSS